MYCTETKELLAKAELTDIHDVRCLTLSHQGKYVALVGNDKSNRDEILILCMMPKENESSSVKNTFRVVARSVSQFNILTLKFSPIEHDRLISCGRENIRFWRTKNKRVAGSAVVLNHHARNTIFTVLDYDFGFDGQPNLSVRNDKIKRVFVGSKHGYLYQVSYSSASEGPGVLEAVFKIHDYSICSIAISSGFCVTGSQDQY